MRFTVKNEFKDGYTTFEKGNSHDSEKVGIPDDRVMIYYRAGFLDIEGEEPGPEPNPQRVELVVENVKVDPKTSKVVG